MLTPLEIQKFTFKKTLGGYSRGDVDDIFFLISSDYEELYKENIKQRDRIEVLEGLVSKYTGMEDTMRETLVVAQKAADDLAKSAHEKAEQIMAKAENEAAITVECAKQTARDTMRENEKARTEIIAYAAQVSSILDMQKALVEKILELRSDKDGLQSDVESAEDSLPDEGVSSAEGA